ncbi:MAG TPA: response regulator transcription factor [Desulfobacteraceae bacterium]|nr:response regulator transcription factor [Desulfobacteraceae bacterium]
MANEKILVVDDEEDILELLRYSLAREGYSVHCADTGEKAVSSAKENAPDILVLDLMLPGMDGLEVTRVLKSDPHTRSIPIIMLTAKGEEADIVAGLELGADDYVTKPFSPRVLTARVRAVLRRGRAAEAESPDVIRFEDLVIHPGRHQVFSRGREINLTLTEFGILTYLARRPGWVFTRSQIVDAVKGADYFVTDRSVDVQVAGLRKKLGDAGSRIETVRGVGYRFKE